MDEVKISLIIGVITFVVVLLVDYLFILLPKYRIITNKKVSKKRKKNTTIMEMQFLCVKFNLDENKINLSYLIKWIAFLNALIISFSSTIIFFIPLKIMWQLLIGFVIVFGLIYALYELLGRHLVRKGCKK